MLNTCSTHFFVQGTFLRHSEQLLLIDRLTLIETCWMLQVIRDFPQQSMLHLGWDFQKILRHWSSVYHSDKAKSTTLMNKLPNYSSIFITKQYSLVSTGLWSEAVGAEAKPHIFCILTILIEISTNLVTQTKHLLVVHLSSLERSSARAL